MNVLSVLIAIILSPFVLLCAIASAYIIYDLICLVIDILFELFRRGE